MLCPEIEKQKVKIGNAEWIYNESACTWYMSSPNDFQLPPWGTKSQHGHNSSLGGPLSVSFFFSSLFFAMIFHNQSRRRDSLKWQENHVDLSILLLFHFLCLIWQKKECKEWTEIDRVCAETARSVLDWRRCSERKKKRRRESKESVTIFRNQKLKRNML